jgi:monofunctional glycosyltransferase
MALVRKYFWDAIVLWIVFSFGWVILYRFVPIPGTFLMVKRAITTEGDLYYSWADWHQISPYIKVCAMASEDQNLPFHYGMDIDAIGKAFAANARGRKTFGASTITQQVAKNAFLFPNRSYIRKAFELYFTFLIETLWPKERILEVYLNIAEMGDQIFGVEAAAKRYYGKSAAKLNLNESATIISVLPSPRKYNARNPGPYVSRRRGEIISLYNQLDGQRYLRELYIRSDRSLYDFRKYKK